MKYIQDVQFNYITLAVPYYKTMYLSIITYKNTSLLRKILFKDIQHNRERP